MGSGNLSVMSFSICFFTHVKFSVRATNAIWPPLFKTSPAAENTTTLLPSFSDRPPLSWQHAMAQHLLGFSSMASDCISCPGIRSPLSHKHPALSENLQHTAAYRAIEVCLCLHLNILCVRIVVCVFVCSRNATQRTFSSHNSKSCATAFVLISQVILCTEAVSYFLLGCHSTFIFHNLYQLLWFFYCHHMLSGNFEFVISAYDFATPKLTLLSISCEIFQPVK